MVRQEQVCGVGCNMYQMLNARFTHVGKTMTANAVANYLKKKILLVTVSVMMERDLTKVHIVFF